MAAAGPWALLLVVSPKTVTDFGWAWLGAALLGGLVWIGLDQEHSYHSDDTSAAPFFPVPVAKLVLLAAIITLALIIYSVGQGFAYRIKPSPSRPTATRRTAAKTTSDTTSTTAPGTVSGRAATTSSTAAPPPACKYWPGRGVEDPATAQRTLQASQAGSAEEWGCLAGAGSVKADCWVQEFASGRAIVVGRKYAAAVVGDLYLKRLRADLGDWLCSAGEMPTNVISFADVRRDVLAIVDPHGKVLRIYGRPNRAMSQPVAVDPALLSAYALKLRTGTALVPVSEATRGPSGTIEQRFATEDSGTSCSLPLRWRRA